MNKYEQTINEIRRHHRSTADIGFMSAVQTLFEIGYRNIDNAYLKAWHQAINKRHDEAQINGQLLFCTRNFELDIADCTYELAQKTEPIDLLKYIQKNWLYYDMGDMDYKRATDVLKDCINYVEYDTDEDLAIVQDKLYCMGFRDDDLSALEREDLIKLYDEEDD